jgi:hypothetical protein
MLFRHLRDKGVELFADEPAVAERIWLLYNEILADEIGHVGFIAAWLDEHGRSVMRRMYARLWWTLASQFSEMVTLLGRAEMAIRVSAFRSRACDCGVADPGIRSGACLLSPSVKHYLVQDSELDKAMSAIAILLVFVRLEER